MSDVSEKPRHRTPLRRQRSIYQVHYCLQRRADDGMARPLALPFEQLQAYPLQVAGHQNTDTDTDRKYLGLLQCSGKILKPILKECQRREMVFYARLNAATDPDLVEFRKYVAQYYGCRKFTYNGYEQDYIILEDLTERMLEPCIMDVKIGKRTWDPLASEEKIEREKSKYKQCKEEFGFCIPGYQVFRLSSGKLCKYGKDSGKRLHGHLVRAAIKNFLNGLGSRLCRALILQFLSSLWAVQRWAGRPRTLRLYATSLLLVYDAARLRDCCGEHDAFTPHMSVKCRPTSAPIVRRKSIHSLHNPASGSFSGALTAAGPAYTKLGAPPPAPLRPRAPPPPPPLASPWTEALDKLNMNHSFEHNYEDKLSKIKMNYRAMLDQLCSETPTPNPWGTVKVIDFAHAFFNDDDEPTVDENFKEGIDNLVDIFEALLRETDDQVF